jgi:hypothetical protein
MFGRRAYDFWYLPVCLATSTIVLLAAKNSLDGLHRFPHLRLCLKYASRQRSVALKGNRKCIGSCAFSWWGAWVPS